MKRIRLSLLHVLVCLMLIASLMFPTGRIDASIPSTFHVLFVRHPDAKVKMVKTKIKRDPFAEVRYPERNGIFLLYAVPLSVTSYEEAESYAQPENRLFCIDIHGQPDFIMGGEDSIPKRGKYTKSDTVFPRLRSVFGVTDEDFDLAGRALHYNHVGEGKPYLDQDLVYLAFKQAEISDQIVRPSKATETMKELDEKNASLWEPEYTDSGLAVNLIAETHLMVLRDAVRPTEEQKKMEIDAPGKYAFPAISGYAIPGMKAESQDPAIQLSKEQTDPLSRESLLEKEDSGYQLSFTIPESAPDGTYTLTVTRPDFTGHPEWTGYATNTDPMKSTQWLGSVVMKPAVISDTFTVVYKNAKPESEASQAPSEADSAALPVEPKPEPSPEPNPEPEPKSDSKTDAKPDPKPEPKPDSKPEPQPEPPSKPKTEPDAEPKTEPKVKPEAEPKTETKTKSEAEPKTEPKTKSDAGPQAEPKAEPKLEPHSDAPLDRKADAASQRKANAEDPSITVRTSKTEAPRTGDVLRTLLWAVIGLVAGVGLIALEIMRRKEKKARHR